MNNPVQFNLNSPIKVRLTDAGYEHMARHGNRYRLGLNERTAEHYRSQADAEGFTMFSAWCLIEIFGEVTGQGRANMFEMNTQIDVNDLKRID